MFKGKYIGHRQSADAAVCALELGEGAAKDEEG